MRELYYTTKVGWDILLTNQQAAVICPKVCVYIFLCLCVDLKEIVAQIR